MRTPEEELETIREAGLWRQLRPVEATDGPRVTLEGRTYLNFSSNDYLGLSRHPALAEAARLATERFGTGSTASRLICGSLAPHHELEECIAALKETEAALAFSSGYATAVGTITALAGKDDILILDKLCHASLVDGARLSGATIRIFPHNNLDRLEQLLERSTEKLSAQGRIIVMTESVFSMDGDVAPLEEIIALKKRFGILCLLDEAHALGVLGPRGLGLAEELGLQQSVDLQLGSLGKAAGCSGGYLAASRTVIDLLINKARSFIYSTAPIPAQAAAATTALRLISTEEGTTLRGHLRERLDEFSSLTGSAMAATSIIPVPCGDNADALAAAESLRSAGLLVPAIRYPTVPRGQARLRITLSAAHDSRDVAALAEAVNSLPNRV
jgi:8-amino-7-oxononanoate synthase